MKNLRIKTLPLLVAAVLCHLSASVRAETECPLGDASARSAIMELCPFKSGLARIEIGHRWGFVDADGKLVIAPQFDAVQDFSEGVAAAQVDEKWGLIDRQGKWIVAPAFDDVQPFSGGLAAAHKDGKYGYIDPIGKWIIAPAYADAGNFSGPVAVVRERYPHAMLIDKQGRVVKRFAADVRVQDYGGHEGRFVATIEPAPLLLHVDGRTLPMPEGAASHGYQAQHFIASKQEQRGEDTVILYGLADVHGKWVVPAIYKTLEEFNGKLAIASLDGHLHGLVNKSGKMVTAPRYKRIKRQEDGRYMAERADQTDKTDLLDESGKFLFALDCGDVAGQASIGTLRILSGCQKQWLVHARDGIIASHEGERDITVRGKHVLIIEKNTDELRPALRFDIYNDAGKRVGGSDSAPTTEQDFNTVGLPAGKSARRPDYALPLAIYGKFSDKVSLLTHDYQLITRPDWHYDSALLEYLYSDDKDEFEGPLVMKGEDGFGAIDAKGNWLIEPRYRTLSSFKHGLAIARTDEDTVLIDATGKTYPFPDEGVRFTRTAYMVVEGESDAGIISIDLRTGERTTREALEYGYDNPLADGLRATKKDEKWGITDENARWVLAPAYDRAPKPVMHAKKLLGWISELDMPGSDRGDYLHGLLDRNGRELIKPRFTSLKSDDKTGLLLATETDGRQSVLNANGKVVIKPVLASLTSLGDGWFSAEMSHLHGLIDQRGEWLVKPDRFAVQLDRPDAAGMPRPYSRTVEGGATRLVDIRGRTSRREAPAELPEAESSAWWWAEKAGGDDAVTVFYGFNFKERVRIPGSVTSDLFSEGVIAFKSADAAHPDQIGLADDQGKVIGMYDYLSIDPMVNGLAKVSKEVKLKGGKPQRDSDGEPVNRFGFIDRSGKLQTPVAYDRAGDFSEKRATVLINGGLALIDAGGKIVLQGAWQCGRTPTLLDGNKKVVWPEEAKAVVSCRR